MGYKVFTRIAMFDPSEKEEIRLEDWIADEQFTIDGVTEWTEWKYETDEDLITLSKEFPLIMFALFNFGADNNDYKYVTLHNGHFSPSFNFSAEEDDQIEFDICEAGIISLEEQDNDDTDQLYELKDIVRDRIIKKKMSDMNLTDISDMLKYEDDEDEEENVTEDISEVPTEDEEEQKESY